MSAVLWFTGLSGSGKSTVASRVEAYLIGKGKRVLMLDGDVVRTSLHARLGFSREDIVENNRLIAELVSRKKDEVDVVLVPVISPFENSRKEARERIGDDFVLVHVNCPTEEVVRRDTKGLYAKASRGELGNLIGISPDVPYETPTDAEIEIHSFTESIESGVTKVIHFLETTGRV